MVASVSSSRRPRKIVPRLMALVRVERLGDAPPSGAVLHELLVEQDDITREFTPQLLASCVDVTDHDPRPEPGWVLGENGRFAPTPDEPTPLHEMSEALAAGVEAVVNGHEVGRVHADGQHWESLSEEAQHARLYGVLAGEGKTVEHFNLAGESIVLDHASLLALHRALLGWRIAWRRYADGRGPRPTSDKIVVEGGR